MKFQVQFLWSIARAEFFGVTVGQVDNDDC